MTNKKKIFESIDLSFGLPDDRLVVVSKYKKHIEIPFGNYTMDELEAILNKAKEFIYG